MATKKTTTTDDNHAATFTFDAEKKHSWLYREDAVEGEAFLLRSVYISKERFPTKPGQQIALVIKTIS